MNEMMTWVMAVIHTVIVGLGVAGLKALYKLVKRINSIYDVLKGEHGLVYRVTRLEKRSGLKMRTRHDDAPRLPEEDEDGWA